MPLPLKIEKILKKRNYRIYTTNPLTGEDRERIERRGIRLQADEWVAILNYWQNAHIKGPAEKPYVPALRTMAPV
jgi:hypothetical protein